MFNIKKLAIASEADMPVTDPKGQPVFDDEKRALSITFMSPGTREFNRAKHVFDEIVNEQNMMRLKDKPVAEGEFEKARAEFFATVTKSFNNFDYDGRGGFEAYKAAYMDPEIGHITEAANKFLGDRGNFYTAFKKASSNTSDTSHG